MQSNPVFYADAAAVFDHLFEDEAILELSPLIEDDIDVEVAVADVSVPEDESACLFSEVGEEVGPCSDIEGDVVGQDLFFLSDGGDCDILSDLPDLVVGRLLRMVWNLSVLSTIIFFIFSIFSQRMFTLVTIPAFPPRR